MTIAVINSLRYTHFRNKTTYFGPHPDYYVKPVPPNGHVSLWMEEARLSPATLKAAEAKEQMSCNEREYRENELTRV